MITMMEGMTNKNNMFSTLQKEVVVIQKQMNEYEQTSIHQEDMGYYLYNILSDELIRITNDILSLQKIMEILIRHKYFKSKRITDDEFLKEVYKIQIQYSSLI